MQCRQRKGQGSACDMRDGPERDQPFPNRPRRVLLAMGMAQRLRVASRHLLFMRPLSNDLIFVHMGPVAAKGNIEH